MGLDLVAGIGRPPVFMPGDKFGMLTITESTRSDAYGNRQYLCRCDCGSEKWYYAWQLRSGDSVSCGCRKRTPGRRTAPEKTKD